MANPASNPQITNTVLTNTAGTPTPTLPPRRIEQEHKALQKALRDLYAAVQSGGFAYNGQRQPTYPLKGLVTNFMSLPNASDAGLGSYAYITDSLVQAVGSNWGTPVQGGGVYVAPVYVGKDPNTGFNQWYLG